LQKVSLRKIWNGNGFEAMSISGLIGPDVGSLGHRFNLVGIIPSTVLAVFIIMLFLLWSEPPTTVPNIEVLVSKFQDFDLKQGVLLVVAITVFSIIIQPLQMPLVRFLEGYWGNSKLGRVFTKIGTDIQRGRLREISDAAKILGDDPPEQARLDSMWNAHLELIQNYPKKEDRLLPMSLGNVLRAAEDSAGQKYGLDTVATWPRLYPSLSDSMKSIVDDQTTQLDVATRFCVIFVIATIISLILYFAIIYNASINDLTFRILFANPSLTQSPLTGLELWAGLAVKYGWWLIFPASSLILSWLSYKGAVSVAITFGQITHTAFDLHRFDMLKALHLPLPADLKSEIEDNEKLSDFLIDSTYNNYRYHHPDEDEKDDESNNRGSPLP
jgi:hypothetical protein